MMLTWLGERYDDEDAKAAAVAIDKAVGRALTSTTTHTGDLGGDAKTSDVGDAVASEL
jgi:isocitrate/isopropylmalate dehydrogenase